jgi:TonB family protein
MRGVVRLDVLVDANGDVADVHVIDASPPGIYETQAVAELRSRHYEPATADGAAVPSHHLEIVDFTITPAADGRSSDDGADG